MGKCEEVQARMFDYLSGLSSSEELADMEAHLAFCETCSRGLAGRKKFEQALLQARAESRMPAPLTAATLARLQPRRRRSPGLPWLVAAAAAVLIVWFMNPSAERKAGPGVSAIDIAGLAAAERFNVNAVLSTKDARAALLEDMYTGEQRLVRTGDALAGSRIDSISERALVFVDAEGLRHERNVSSMDADRRAADVAVLRTAWENGLMKPYEFDRLIAQFNRDVAGAATLLSEIANSPDSTFQARAWRDLYGQVNGNSHDRLLSRIRDMKSEYRAEAVQGLARMNTPKARAALRQVAFNPEDPQASAALLCLGRVADLESVSELRALIEREGVSDELRAAAEEALRSILDHGANQ